MGTLYFTLPPSQLINKYTDTPEYQVSVQMGLQAAQGFGVEIVEMEMLTAVETFPVGQADKTIKKIIDREINW